MLRDTSLGTLSSVQDCFPLSRTQTALLCSRLLSSAPCALLLSRGAISCSRKLSSIQNLLHFAQEIALRDALNLLSSAQFCSPLLRSVFICSRLLSFAQGCFPLLRGAFLCFLLLSFAWDYPPSSGLVLSPCQKGSLPPRGADFISGVLPLLRVAVFAQGCCPLLKGAVPR